MVISRANATSMEMRCSGMFQSGFLSQSIQYNRWCVCRNNVCHNFPGHTVTAAVPLPFCTFVSSIHFILEDLSMKHSSKKISNGSQE